jgi:hypothetical protein
MNSIVPYTAIAFASFGMGLIHPGLFFIFVAWVLMQLWSPASEDPSEPPASSSNQPGTRNQEPGT